jgi:hypothetical protein
MRRRIRCDCKLRGLPEAQRLIVDAWLFKEGFTYEEVVEGCLREFGLKVSKSSVGRYYERVSADRFAKLQREKWEETQPELSPAEAYKVLLQRIAKLAWEEMDQPLKDINHKVVVRLVRVLIAARREKHMETRVWVERRRVENWLAREVLRHWRREAKKQAHVSYLPIWGEGKREQRNVVRMASDQSGTAESPALKRHECRAPRSRGGGGPLEERQLMARLVSNQVNAVENLTLKRHECRAPGRDAPDQKGINEAKSGHTNPLYLLRANSFALGISYSTKGT